MLRCSPTEEKCRSFGRIRKIVKLEIIFKENVTFPLKSGLEYR